MPRWAIDITAGTGGFEAAVKRIPASLKKETDKASKHAQQLSQSIQAVGKAGRLAFPVMGALGEQVSGAVTGFAALGPAGLAVGAGLGVVGAAGGALLAAKAIVDLEERAYKAIPRLERLAEAGLQLVPAESIEAVRQAHYALQGIGVIADATAVVLAEKFAPAVERVAVDIVAFGLAALDAKDAFFESAAAVKEYGDKIADIVLLVAPAGGLLPGISDLGTALQAGALGWKAASSGIEVASDALSEWEIANADYLGEAREIIGVNRQVEESHRSKAAAIREDSEATKEIARVTAEYQRRLSKEIREELAWQQEELDIRARIRDEEERAAEQAMRQAEQDARDRIALERLVSDSRVSLASTTAGSLASIASLIAEREGEGARRAWAIASGAAVVQAGLDAALAVSRAFASVPWPASVLAAVEAGIQGAANLAAVTAAASRSIPSAYTGSTDYPYASTMGTPTILHPHEEVRTRTEAEEPRGGLVHVSTWIRGREVADTTAQEVRRGGSLTAEIARRAGKVGRSSAYRS